MQVSIDYIKKNYLTREQLSERTALSEPEIDAFISHNCLPKASYVISETVEIRSFFGHPQERTEIHYFACSHVARIQQLIELQPTKSKDEIASYLRNEFVSRFKELLIELNGFENGYHEYFVDAENINQEKATQLANTEWNYVLDGTYGLCTRHVTVYDILLKEMMIRKIRLLTDDCKKTMLTETEREEVSGAIHKLRNVQADFAPHERAKSSRYKSIDRVIERYSLSSLETV